MIRQVAVIGARIGAAHVAGFRTLPDRYSVAVICDLDRPRGAALAEEARARHVAAIDDVLADPQIDIVDICLPPHLHFEACMAALEAGKHVICEKPLVTSLRACDALAAKVAETGRMLWPVFQYRFGQGSAQFAALRDAGLLGRGYAATLETHWNRQAAYYDIPWRGTWAGESGGAILGHAIHIHDLLSFLLGPVAAVHAVLATRVNDIEVEDTAALAITMGSGALVTSSVTLGAADDTSRIRAMYSGLTLESDHAPYAPAAEPWQFTARAPQDQSAIDAVLETVAPSLVGYPGMFAAIADALDGRPASPVTLDDARRSIEFVTAVYASGRNGQTERLPLPQAHDLYAGWVPD